mmetsp:Transcript_95487/g.269879  ORF Transcript_95487/g.269879 Transcript_95487/m.269879 type:complete len:630 (-) Transcript_95487:91-1980(-)
MEELKLQLELAVDIEDWDKVHHLTVRIRELDPSWQPRGETRGRGGSSQLQAWPQQQPRGRSRSPRRSRRSDQPVERWGPNPNHHVANENPIVIEYNKSIKHHLQKGSIEAARHVLADMQFSGIRPTVVTYNEFLNFYAKCKDVAEGLRVVAEMRRQGLQPNRVSASTILKALSERPLRDHVEEVVNMLRWVSSTEGVDEILLSSVAEATVRMGQHASKLYAVLRRELDEHKGAVWSAQTCGSLIRAHGHTKDVDGMWKQWNAMMGHRIRPTVVTTGCMVEQLVMNGQVNAAYDLVRSLEKGGFSECVNAVVYYSLVKGFALEKDADRVWGVYQEMRMRRLQTSVTTYNGLVGAFSESGLVDRVNVLFSQMKSEGLTPTVCTWSRLAKGYCLRGDVKKAVEIMEQMRSSTGLKPDEIFYNTLLDACAEQGLVADGLGLLERMEREGVPASKYTLSILAKMLVRAGKIERALSQVEELSRRHGLEISANIFTTLLGACAEHGDSRTAESVLKKMAAKGAKPDRRAFTTLVKRFLSMGTTAEALEAARRVLRVAGNARTLQGLLDRQALQEALTIRASTDGVEEVKPLLDEVKRATDNGFWFDLELSVRKARSLENGGRRGRSESRAPEDDD